MTRNRKCTKLEALKKSLREAGWNDTTAAAECGVRREHVNLVLNGRRESQRLLAKLEDLSVREVAAAK